VDNDSFEKIDQYSRREVLKFLSYSGAMGTIVFLLNNCTLPAGMRQIIGEVFINGRRIRPDQLKETDGVLVENDASISTGSAGSAVFVIGRNAFIIRGNSRRELNPTLDRKQN